MSQYETLSLCLSGATLIFLAIYVAKTWSIAKSNKESAEQTRKLIEETRISRDEETAPRVIVYFDLHEQVAEFVIRNIGRSVANNVKISIEPDISNLIDKETPKYYGNLITQGIKMLAPDQEIRSYINTTPAIFKKSDAPTAYNIQVSFEGGLLNKRRVHQSSIDLSLFATRQYIRRPGLKDIAKELTNIGKAITQLSRLPSLPSEIEEEGKRSSDMQ